MIAEQKKTFQKMSLLLPVKAVPQNLIQAIFVRASIIIYLTRPQLKSTNFDKNFWRYFADCQLLKKV
jgi:hypothetical protein